MKNFLKGLTKNIVLLGLVSLFTDLGSQMVFPLVPLYMTGVLGASAYAVGIVEGAAETTASLFKVISGYWSDKIKRRKPFVLFGYGLSAVTKPLFAFATLWPLVLGARAIERIGKGLRDAPRDALVAESSDPAYRGKVYGFHRAMDGMGSVLGALMGFLLLPVLGFKNIFLFAFIPGVIATLTVLFVREKKRTPEEIEAQKHEKKKTLRVSFKALPNNLRLFILASAVFALGNFGYAFMLLKAKSIGLSDSNAILLYVLYYGIYTLLTTPLGALSDKIGRKPVLMAGYAIFAIAGLGLAFASNFYLLIGLFVLYGIFFAMTDGGIRALTVDLAPPDLKGTALGTLQTAIGIVALPGGFICGMLWDKISPEATFIYGTVMTLLSMAMLFFVRKKDGNVV